MSYYWSSSGRICWSLNSLCSQSCLLNFCYYFCTECCVRVPHFNSTANKASSLPWVSPVANQCSGKHSHAIHQLLQGCPERRKWALKDWGRAEEQGSYSLQGEESRGLGTPSSQLLPALTFLGVFSVQGSTAEATGVSKTWRAVASLVKCNLLVGKCPRAWSKAFCVQWKAFNVAFSNSGLSIVKIE